MALAALLALLGVQSESEGVEKYSKINTFLTNLCSVMHVGTHDEALTKVQAQSSAMTELESLTGKSGKEAVAAASEWKTQNTKLAGEVAKLEAEKATAKKEREDQERDDYVAQLSTEGKLPPSLHAWAKTQTKASLEEFAKGAPTHNPADRSTSSTGSTGGQGTTPGGNVAVTLSAEERKICEMTGTSEAAYLERKKFEAKQQAEARDVEAVNPGAAA